MRINSIPSKEIFYQYVYTKEKPSAVPTQNLNADKVELTSNAKTFSAALKSAKETIGTRSPQDTKKLDEIKRQIQNNTYNIPGEKVAEKMLGK